MYVNESLADDDILTKLTRVESGALITIFISLGSILDERMSCEVFESMDTITLRAQADIAAIWCTTIDDSSCRGVESKFPNCETMSLLTLTELHPSGSVSYEERGFQITSQRIVHEPSLFLATFLTEQHTFMALGS